MCIKSLIDNLKNEKSENQYQLLDNHQRKIESG